ncbi:uncharacterized protein K452DRAFT_321604 [Aplosporella prunicola CBS 121167]|uniref:Uncharacterized protein n=1 Tax=Aplosporella prunicola CBS 121167 TaxID=1176127 RepID=A0A6A6B473_9PEZI|nr:uncharacterized protein K452DRAFT_321604 [Aplosporella prunicola CBS 121167]KAF2137757.1 hypothetical protein K452DRAFT_321604 [Aplosporella prunicola CBS 121167]
MSSDIPEYWSEEMPFVDVEDPESWLKETEGTLFTSEHWYAREAEELEDLRESETFRMLEALVQQPDVSPEDAVQHLVDRILNALKPDNGYEFLPCDGIAICTIEVAIRTSPEKQRKLIDMLLLLQDTTVINPATGAPVIVEHDSINLGVAFRDLPSFGYILTDNVNAHSMDKPAHLPEVEQHWVNHMTFLAQVSAAEVRTDIRSICGSCKALKSLTIEWGSMPIDNSDIDIEVFGPAFSIQRDSLEHLVIDMSNCFLNPVIPKPIGSLKSLHRLKSLEVNAVFLTGVERQDKEPSYALLADVLPQSLEVLRINPNSQGVNNSLWWVFPHYLTALHDWLFALVSICAGGSLPKLGRIELRPNLRPFGVIPYAHDNSPLLEALEFRLLTNHATLNNLCTRFSKCNIELLVE